MNDPEAAADGRAAPKALAGINFALPDFQGGLVPFAGIVLTLRGWTPGDIGLALTAASLAGVAATVPLGALTDATRAKRALLIAAVLSVGAAALGLLAGGTTWVVAAALVGGGVAAAALGTLIGAITLGLVGQDRFARQVGRNEAWNHAGNAATAGIAAAAGLLISVPAALGAYAAAAVAAGGAALALDPSRIDDAAARGGGDAPHGARELLRLPGLVPFALALGLLQLGNAGVLPLLSQVLAGDGAARSVSWTAGGIAASQLVMIPAALGASALIGRGGLRWVLLGAGVALPLRGLLAWALPGAAALIPAQLLDGLGAGLLAVALPAAVERLTRGSGRYNLALTGVLTVQGLGAALSTSLGGLAADAFGAPAAFLALAGAGTLALAVLGAGLAFAPGFPGRNDG